MPAMAGPPHWCRRRIAKSVLAALVVALVLVVAPGPPAQAHTDLLRSSPAAGSLRAGPPSEVTLTFSEAVDPELSALSLEVDGDSLGRLRLTSGRDPGTLVGNVPDADLGIVDRASWTVGYRVTSVDGHPIAGTLEFAVAAAPSGSDPSAPLPSPSASVPSDGPSPVADSPADAASETTEPTSGTAASDGVDNGQGWWVPAMVLLLVVLGAIAALRLGRSAEDEEGPQPTAATEKSPS